MGIAALLYGALCYLIFLGSALYAVGFVCNVGVPKSIDSGASVPALVAACIDLALLAVFALQHSVMARPAFKRWCSKLVAPSIERSTYVLASSLALVLLFLLWRPLPILLWNTEGGQRLALQCLCAAGWVMAVASTFLISHLDLFGLRQTWLRYCSKPYSSPPFDEPGLYKLVRHPMMLGFLIAFWAAPDMSLGRLLFAAASSLYIVAGVCLEERDLEQALGEPYRGYRRRVGMLLPRLRK